MAAANFSRRKAPWPTKAVRAASVTFSASTQKNRCNRTRGPAVRREMPKHQLAASPSRVDLESGDLERCGLLLFPAQRLSLPVLDRLRHRNKRHMAETLGHSNSDLI